MSELERIGVAIDRDLLRRFDSHIEGRAYANRSEAFRDLIRDTLIRDAVKSDPETPVVGTLTLVYDHHTRQLNDKLTGIQHDNHHLIVSTLHVHLDRHLCLEVIILKGKSSQVHSTADKLISTKGVQHGNLSVTVA